MSEYYPVCPNNPCPVCGDTSGKCSISEYGYCLECYGVCDPDVQKGDLRGFWKCFRVGEERSQWEDQRVTLNAQVNSPKVTSSISTKSIKVSVSRCSFSTEPSLKRGAK